MNFAIISAKPGKTSGGITGFTYNHMKAWSKNFKREVYNNLTKTWKAMEAPDWWKWRWLCPIPKNTVNNSLAGQPEANNPGRSSPQNLASIDNT